MSSEKEIKRLLKEAKEAKLNNDYEKSKQLCKEILKADRNNYMALVLLGISMYNTEQKDDAPKAFQKAIELDPQQILAWQGLALYYENEEKNKNYNFLLDIYQNLLKLESVESKWCSIFEKFSQAVIETDQFDTFLRIFEDYRDTENEEKRQVMRVKIVAVLSNTNHPLQQQHYDLLYDVFKMTNLSPREAFIKLLLLLKKKKDLEMMVHYTKNEEPVDSIIGSNICELFGKLCIERPGSFRCDIGDFVTKWFPSLTKENPLNTNLMLSRAVILMENSSCSEARDLLESYVSNNDNPSSWHAYVLLGQTHLKLLCYEEAESCAYKAEKCKLGKEIQDVIDNLLLQAIVHSSDEDKLKKGIELSKKLLVQDRSNILALNCMARASLNLGNWEVVEKLARKLEETGGELNAMLLKIEMAEKKGEKVSLDLLNSLVKQFPESAEAWYLLGIYNIREDRLQEGIPSLFKAAKKAPYWYTVYLQIGLYYKSIKDLVKARRCLKKALYLNQRSNEVGMALSDVYRAQNDSEMNLDLLNAIAKTTGSKWAWLQLGVQYSVLNDIDNAIKCLLVAIRNDPTDSESWEVLADSYLARKAYTAALKSYKKVVELKPSAVYPALQIAGIKLLIGDIEESLSEFRHLVKQNPKNVPALKGLTEACIEEAKNHYLRRLLGISRNYLQEALAAITCALNERPDLSCIWKLMGDVLIQCGDLPPCWSYIEVPLWVLRKENNSKEETETLTGLSLYELSTRCYSFALQLMEKIGSTSLLWHDLTASYVSQARLNKDISQKKHLMQKAFNAGKRSVSLNPVNWKHWNLLGVIASSPEINDKPLAQHAFINSILAEEKNAVAWTNLGILYSELDGKLANKAFNAAQRINDTYNQCWIGQALLAEKIKHGDTLDLFRHTTELDFHPESAIGYAQNVCHTLKMDVTNKAMNEYYEYAIEKTFAVAVSVDAMTWYSEERENDSCGLNLLGCLQERSELLDSAVASYNKALDLLRKGDGNEMGNFRNFGDDVQTGINRQRAEIVRTNLGRTLLRLNRNDEAISILKRIDDRDFQTECNLALAYYKAGMYDEAVKQYNSIKNKYLLHPNRNNERLADILIAKAAVCYKKGDTDTAGSLLKECRMLKQETNHPYVLGLFAEFAFCILERDLDSSKNILSLMQPLLTDSEYITDISTFDAYTRFIEEDLVGMVRSLQKSVHTNPWLASLWLNLAVITVEKHCNSSTIDPKIAPRAEAAALCANKAMRIGRGTSMDVRKVLPIASVSHLQSGNVKRSLAISQHAVHLYPHVAEGWAVLLASARAMKCSSYVAQSLLLYLRKNLDSKNYLSEWVDSIEPKICS